MNIDLSEFIKVLFADPVLFFIVLITLGVILLNGWVDAPNTIFTSVSSGSLSTKEAIVLAAVFNFLGVAVMSVLSAKVAYTISNLVYFESSYKNGMIALSAALVAIVVWTIVSNHFRLPTSETHAMVAGITAAAITVSGGISAINGEEWLKVLCGIVIPLVFGFGLTWVIAKAIEKIFGGWERKKALFLFQNAQMVSFAGTSFMHGAQDGQKFMGILLIAIFLEKGGVYGQTVILPIWMIILCGIFMTAGTVIGGIRIQKSTGLLKFKLEKYQSFSADFSTTCTLLAASSMGIPVSTNHTKIASILGAEGAKGFFSIDLKAMRIMLFSIAWTYLGCGIISVVLTLLFLKIV